MVDTSSSPPWVLLTYWVPREPSTPRIAVWRRLKRLGVAQLGDGLVALPADARTQEQLEWVAEQAEQAGGRSSVWWAQPTAQIHGRRLVEEMARARAQEYRQLLEKVPTAEADPATARASLTRLRAEQRRIERRDYFPPPERARARAALRDLASRLSSGDRERA